MVKQFSDNAAMKTHKKLVEEIISTGISQKDLGARIGKSQAWVCALLSGKFKDVKWTEGNAIRKIHSEIVANKMDCLPATCSDGQHQKEAA